MPLESFTSTLSISIDAGSFICNETYAQTLNALAQVDKRDRLGRQLPVVFLHLPSEEKLDLDTQVNLVEEVVAWMVNRPILSVAAGVLSDADGRLLSCRRSPEEVFAGEWEFPGGKLEVGEDIPTCIKRELLEELGVAIEPLRPLCVNRVLSGSVEMELHVWEVAWVAGEISLSVHDKKRWLEVDELEGAKWIEADIAMISIIAKKLANQAR
jgi:8-oxo-dGTP diphosphatase